MFSQGFNLALYPKKRHKKWAKKKKWKKKCNIHFLCWVRRFSHATKNQLRSLYCVNFSNISRNFAAPWSSFGWANKECPTSFAQLVLAGSKLLWRVFFGRSSTRIWVNSHTHTHTLVEIPTQSMAFWSVWLASVNLNGKLANGMRVGLN